MMTRPLVGSHCQREPDLLGDMVTVIVTVSYLAWTVALLVFVAIVSGPVFSRYLDCARFTIPQRPQPPPLFAFYGGS